MLIVFGRPIIGWGEAQSPVAPEVVGTIVKTLLAPILMGEDPMSHERLWSRMYNAMRVRGHTGSFLLDVMAGIDTALWDIKGKALNAHVCALVGGPFVHELPAYISGLSGADDAARITQAAEYQQRGCTAFKLFMDGESQALLALHDGLRQRLGSKTKLMLDVLWRLEQAEAVRFGRVWNLYEAGKHREARAEFNRHLPLIRFELQSGLGVSAMKHHLQAAGIIKYVTVRPPTRSLDAIAVEELRQIVSDLACYGRRKP